MIAASSVTSKIVTRTKSEVVFRPWWDMVNDTVIGSLFSLGTVSVTS